MNDDIGLIGNFKLKFWFKREKEEIYRIKLIKDHLNNKQ